MKMQIVTFQVKIIIGIICASEVICRMYLPSFPSDPDKMNTKKDKS